MKTDKAISNILTIALAIIFPLVIYYLISLLFPYQDNGNDIFSYSSYEETDGLKRAITGMLLGLGGMAAVFAIARGYKEIFRGIFSGGVIVVMIANVYMISSSNDENAPLVSLLLWVSFIILTVFMYYSGAVLAEPAPVESFSVTSQHTPSSDNHSKPESKPPEQQPTSDNHSDQPPQSS